MVPTKELGKKEGKLCQDRHLVGREVKRGGGGWVGTIRQCCVGSEEINQTRRKG